MRQGARASNCPMSLAVEIIRLRQHWGATSSAGVTCMVVAQGRRRSWRRCARS